MSGLHGLFEFSRQNRDFMKAQNQQLSKMLNFDHFWRENSNSNRNQFIIITINSFIFDTKIQIHNFCDFSKN